MTQSKKFHPSQLNRPLLSIEQAAILMGISRGTLYRAVNRGEFPLPLIQIGGRWRIPRRAVERLLEGDLPRITPGQEHRYVPPGDPSDADSEFATVNVTPAS